MEPGNPGTWEICNGTCAGTGTSGSSDQQFSIAAPALSGAAMEQSSTTTCTQGECYGFNTLGYRHLGCDSLPGKTCANVSSFSEDMYFYIPSTDDLQALEFDPDLYTGTVELFMSMQCDSGSGDWRFWDMSTNHWVQTSTEYPCTLLTETDKWHHFQLYGTMDQKAKTYTFQTLVVDGAVVYQNIENTYAGVAYSSPPNINIEQQIDDRGITQTNTIYYDNYNLWVW